MRKIPTLFKRDPDDMRRVLPETTEGCEWVLAGEGVATRKYNGVCLLLDDAGLWWARREVKPGKMRPEGFAAIDFDEATAKTVGWEPVSNTGWGKYLGEAIELSTHILAKGHTFELCGPKVNGNPEGLATHMLVRHGATELHGVPRDFAGLREWLTKGGSHGEGIVWWRDLTDRDAGLVKLKARDFPEAR